jgi:hypothetical protein
MTNGLSNSRLVNLARQKDALTENGMVTNSTSLNSCVDMFFMAGAARHWTSDDIKNLFQKALAEDPLTALKLMFWVRDIRGGAGERNFFRVCLTYLEKYYLGYLTKNVKLVPEYGRWDDIFVLDESIFMPLIKDGLEKQDGLLSKWLPRKGNIANSIRKSLGLTPKEYRKMIVGFSNTIEQKMCAKNFESINYEHVPSVAMNKYRKAFYKNDSNRFVDYISNVKSGISKMCATAIYPYQLYDAFIKANKQVDIDAIEAQWNAMPNLLEGSTERIFPIVDTSGSMTWGDALPSRVAWSLAVYISEKNDSIFKDSFMTFATNPQMIYLKGTTAERIRSLRYQPWGGSTNLEASFKLLLKSAIENNLKENEMPTTLLIMSDMQFNKATNVDATALDMIKEEYVKSGYKIPRIVFWNLRAESNNVTASAFDQNVSLVSGFSPNVLKSIVNGEMVQSEVEKRPVSETPYDVMMKTINSERYSGVTI